ncbi:hypothetical protein [Roseomonas sp. WA12]
MDGFPTIPPILRDPLPPDRWREVDAFLSGVFWTALLMAALLLFLVFP